MPAATTTEESTSGDDLTYVFPVQPADAATYGSTHHDYPATDIFCPIGSSFVAPTSGIVDFVSAVDEWDPQRDDPSLRGGISVAIVGDDGVRYYGSHLSSIADGIARGVRVKAGQLLGLTGKSGNARNTPPHLHFGISHPTTPDDWRTRRGEVNPYKYLNAWKQGIPLKPELP
jgi:murein DD-endopeptidase MepM/ murein hydrolase activator NlpD